MPFSSFIKFSQTIPLYILDLQKQFTSHTEALIKLDEKQILTAKELLEEDNYTFGITEILPNKTCSFKLSYISSYLFVRGCIKRIEEKYKINKVDSLQKFLEMLYSSNYINAWLIFDIADFLGLDRNQLLTGKELQLSVLEDIKNEYNKGER